MQKIKEFNLGKVALPGDKAFRLTDIANGLWLIVPMISYAVQVATADLNCNYCCVRKYSTDIDIASGTNLPHWSRQNTKIVLFWCVKYAWNPKIKAFLAKIWGKSLMLVIRNFKLHDLVKNVGN